jgi:hypothetical protein
MYPNQAAQRRHARSVCIVTDKPVRVQAKSNQPTGAFVETKVVRLNGTLWRLRMTATGEVVIDEPP